MTTAIPKTCPPSDAAVVEALYGMGHVMFTQDQYEEAAAIFRIMLQLAPEDERGWLAVGECHDRVGQKQIALELFGAGTVAAKNPVRCALARFRTLYDLGRVDAEDALDEALRMAEAADDADLIELVQHERKARP